MAARLRIRIRATVPEATDEELRAVIRLAEKVDRLPRAQRRRVRLLLHLVYERLKILEN